MANERTFRFKFTGETKDLEGATGRAGGALDSLALKLGPVAAGVGIVGTAVVTAGIAAGTALFKLGGNFDSAYDKIRTSTGAIGAELEGLEESFKTVLASGPDSFDDVALSLSDINVRLGLTGDELESLTGQFLDLARVTEGDLATQIDKGTRLFGDWGVATDDQADALDKLFRATQVSGVEFDQLADSLVVAGAPLRNLGFTLDESTALLALWNKTGVNSETVLAGMKAGVGKLAKAGEDIPATFRRIVDEITRLGPGTEATGLAIELFGQRAGPDLADAIAGGKFNLEEMLAAITGGTDTIKQAAEDTEDFSEKWATFKNKMAVAFEPAAMWVFENVGKAAELALPHLVAFSGWVLGEGKEALDWLAGWWDTNGPAIVAFVDDMKLAWDQFSAGFTYSWDNYVKPAFDQLEQAFADLAAALGFFKDESGNAANSHRVDWVAAGKAVGVVVAALVLGFTAVVKGWEFMARAAQVAAGIVTPQIDGIKSAFVRLRDSVQWVIDKLGALKQAIKDLPRINLPRIPTSPGDLWDIVTNRHSGGIVPGASGTNVPIMAQAGEMVLSAAQTRQSQRSGGGVTVVVNAYGTTGREMVAEIERAVRDGVRANWLTTAGVTV